MVKPVAVIQSSPKNGIVYERAKTPKDGFIRPLGMFEIFLEQCHQKGIMISSYSLTLNSKVALKSDVVKTTLTHLFRKVPTLKLCIQPDSEGKLCYHKMNKEIVDFEVLPHDGYEETFKSVTKYRFNTVDGPLWCAKLMNLPTNHACQVENVKENHPFSYIVIFGFHHAITDGISNITICNLFLSLLNDVLAENTIDDSKEIGLHYSTEITDKLIYEVQEKLKNCPAELDELRKVILDRDYESKFYDCFPPPLTDDNETINVYHSLSVQETSTFLKRCKKEGISVHSGFFSVVNAAIVQMLKEAGSPDECFLIKHYHTVDVRRYWDVDTKNVLGPHLGRLTMMSEMPYQDMIKNFWGIAREFHSTFSNLIQNTGCLKEVIVLMEVFDEFLNEDQALSLRKDTPFYGTTNLGNLDKIFKSDGFYVQATDLRRSTSTQNNLCSHVIHTFRGRLIYGLDYNTQLMKSETANLYVDTIFKTLRRVINE